MIRNIDISKYADKCKQYRSNAGTQLDKAAGLLLKRRFFIGSSSNIDTDLSVFS